MDAGGPWDAGVCACSGEGREHCHQTSEVVRESPNQGRVMGLGTGGFQQGL